MIFVRPAVKNDWGALGLTLAVVFELVWWFFFIFFTVPMLLELFGLLPEDAPIHSVRKDLGSNLDGAWGWTTGNLATHWRSVFAAAFLLMAPFVILSWYNRRFGWGSSR